MSISARRVISWRDLLSTVYSIHSPSSGPPKDEADLQGWGVGGVPRSPTNPPCSPTGHYSPVLGRC